MSESQTKAENQNSLSHSLTLSLSHFLTFSLSHFLTSSLSHSHSLSFTHSRHTEQLLFSCLCSKVTLSLSHYLNLLMSHSHTLTLSLSHSLTLNMMINICFHVYAQKSLFLGENDNAFVWLDHMPFIG